MTRGSRGFRFRDFQVFMYIFASGGFQGGLAPPAPVSAASGDRMCQDFDPAIVQVWLGGAATVGTVEAVSQRGDGVPGPGRRDRQVAPGRSGAGRWGVGNQEGRLRPVRAIGGVPPGREPSLDDRKICKELETRLT